MFYKNKGTHTQSFKNSGKQNLALWNVYLSNQNPTYVCITGRSYEQAGLWTCIWNHTYNHWSLIPAPIPKSMLQPGSEMLLVLQGWKAPCKEEEQHLENGEEPPEHLARLHPSSVLSPNLRTWGQVETKGWWLTRLEKSPQKAENLRLPPAPVPSSRGWYWLPWAGIQVWPRSTAGMDFLSAAMMPLYQLF